MKRLYAAGLLLAGTLANCHRDADSPAYDLTGRYTPGATLTATHPIAMYTKDGLVSNPAAATRFLARRPSLGSSYFSPTDVPSGFAFSVVFRGGNRATLLTPPSYYWPDSIRTEVTDRQAGSFLLQNLDSTFLYTPLAGQSPCNRPGELSQYIAGIRPGRKCRASSPGTGYAAACRVRPVRVVGVRGSQLYIPYYSWLIQSGGCYTVAGGDWNTFNPAIVSQLVAGDTVVVQEREILLSR